ncbi:MAG: tetratricopeptide repeat protein, partial [Pyrinomonadaceae bacterium]
IFYKLGQYNKSLTYLNDAYEMESSEWEILLLLGANFAELGHYDEALQFLEKSYHYHQNLETLSMIGYVQALAGRNDRANQVIKQIESESESKGGEHDSLNLALIHLAMGKKDQAYDLLEEAYDRRAMLIGISFDPRWRSLRSEDKFKELIQTVNGTSEPL